MLPAKPRAFLDHLRLLIWLYYSYTTAYIGRARRSPVIIDIQQCRAGAINLEQLEKLLNSLKDYWNMGLNNMNLVAQTN